MTLDFRQKDLLQGLCNQEDLESVFGSSRCVTFFLYCARLLPSFPR